MALRTLCTLFALSFAAYADNWPQWRGPTNDGHSTEKGLPTEWSAEKNIVWKVPMPGIGAGTPVVWGEKIFITSVDGEEVIAMCISTDGKQQWKKTLSKTGAKRYRNPSGADVSDASASCITDGKHVWAFAGNGTLACFTVDGKDVWKTDITEFGKIAIQFGSHWTPVLYKDKLYLQVFHRTAQKLVCYDAPSGRQIWAVDRKGAGIGESPDVYASATVWEGKEGALLIAHGNDFCTAHQLSDGKEVWRVQDLNPKGSRAWRFVSNPLVTPDLIVVPSCKDGPVVGVDPLKAAGDLKPDAPGELWRYKDTPDVVAPIRVGDIVYLCYNGPIAAVDAKTGKQLYRGNGTTGSHWANMVAVDGMIFSTSQEGATDVFQAGKEFKKIGTNKIPDKIFGSPAIANGRIYFRGYGNLWAIGTK